MPTVTPIPVSALGFIDTHNHLPGGVTLDRLISAMDQANVAKTVLMTVYYGANDPQGQGIADENLVVEFYRQRPDRIIPFLGMQRPVLLDPKRWLTPDSQAENLLTFVETRLKAGSFRGMGEFILWHYPYLFPSGSRGGSVNIPADTPLMRRFLDLAAKYHVPVTLHYEIDEESLPSLKKMLDYGRKTTIILAHNAGRPDPTTLRALMEGYPNVFVDLGGMTRNQAYGRVSEPPQGYMWKVKNPVDDGSGRLRPEWKELYERYSDRFMVGSDLAHPEAWESPNLYRNIFAQFSSLFSDLSLQAAENIGFKNAQKLFED